MPRGVTVGTGYVVIRDVVVWGWLPNGIGRASAGILELGDRMSLPLRWASHGHDFWSELKVAGWVQKELLAGYVPAFSSQQLGGNMFLESLVPKREALDAWDILEYGERCEPSGRSVCGPEVRHVELAQAVRADKVS